MEKHITSLMSQEEIDFINYEINKIKESSEILTWDEQAGEQFPELTETHKIVQNKTLGKIMFNIEIPDSLRDKLKDISTHLGHSATYLRAGYAEYSAEWGAPRLVDHIDSTELFMVDYQLSSNTNWGLVIDGNVYNLKDNDAIAFCPNRHMHGRPEKVFKDGEYVRMLFLEMSIR